MLELGAECTTLCGVQTLLHVIIHVCASNSNAGFGLALAPPRPSFMQEAEASGRLQDPLPAELLQLDEEGPPLPGLLPALRAMHSPASEEEREVRAGRGLRWRVGGEAHGGEWRFMLRQRVAHSSFAAAPCRQRHPGCRPTNTSLICSAHATGGTAAAGLPGAADAAAQAAGAAQHGLVRMGERGGCQQAAAATD